MKLPSLFPRLKGFRFPREIVAYAVWAYHRFSLSTADVEDLLAERGVIVSRETVRLWINRFGRFILNFCDSVAAFSLSSVLGRRDRTLLASAS